MMTAGIDCGAKNTKTVIMKEGTIIGKSVVPTGFDQSRGVEACLALALQHADIGRKDIERILATGTIQFTASSFTTYEATILDNGKMFNMMVGDCLKLNLDPGYDWSPISASDTNVIVATKGIYQAHASGVATLTATGNPKCLNSTPPCGTPSILFTITVIV